MRLHDALDDRETYAGPAPRRSPAEAFEDIGQFLVAPGGTYPVTITGTAGGVTHAVAVTLVISARDFALSVRPSSVAISRGQSAKYTVGVSVVGGSIGDVSLTVAGLPTGTMAVFLPNPVGSPGNSALTVKTTSSTRRGTYTLRITGARGSLAHQAMATLTVR